MKVHKLLLIVTILPWLLFVACGGENDNGEKLSGASILLSVRSSDISFTSGDKAGVFMSYSDLQSTNNELHNLQLMYDGNKWTPERTLCWKDNKTCPNIYAYAPYSEDVTNPMSYLFTTAIDQTDTDSRKNNDLLWGCLKNLKPTESECVITLKRLMSRLIVRVETGDGITEEDLNDGALMVSINNILVQAQVNLCNGTLTPIGNVANVTPRQEQPLEYVAFLVPQQMTPESNIIVQWRGKNYSHAINQTLMSGKSHSVVVTVGKTAGNIGISIGQWETTDEDFGGTVG